jgi:uncharacterized protein YlaI
MRSYPKNRKGISGTPFPRLTNHKLTCGWCGYYQDPELVAKSMKNRLKMSYPCDKCTRRLIIQRTANGLFSAYQADKARYLRNVSLNKNRI